MDLSVGMYVRTKNGSIEKIVDKYEAPYGFKVVVDEKFKFKYYEHNYIKHIKKASHNIIDLIEEHDYIRIISSAFFEPVYYSYGKLVIRDDIDISTYTNKFIAEVITHKQMESMSYKVGE